MALGFRLWVISSASTSPDRADCRMSRTDFHDFLAWEPCATKVQRSR